MHQPRLPLIISVQNSKMMHYGVCYKSLIRISNPLYTRINIVLLHVMVLLPISSVMRTIKTVYENLITNLPDIEFDMDELKELYHLRWSLETAYRDLKYPLCLNSFHSKKYTYIVQEVFARAIMYNFCAEISKQVEVPDQSRKLNYQINFSETIKICRDYLRNQTNDNVLNVEGLIADNIEPIRPNRTFRRQARFKLPMSFCYR